MLENVLKGLISSAGQQAVVQNSAIPNQFNQGVMDEVLSGLMGGMKNQVAQPGGLGSMLSLFGGNSSSNSLMNNPLVAGIAKNIIGNLMAKFGLSNQIAQGVVASVIPSVLGGLVSKTNNASDNSINLGGLFGELSGGKTNGLDLGSLLAGGQSALADGKLDLNDAINLLGGGNKSGGGLVGNLLGGLFGKK